MEDKNFRRRLISNSQDAIHLPAGYKKLKYIYGLGNQIVVPKGNITNYPRHIHLDFGNSCSHVTPQEIMKGVGGILYNIEVDPDNRYGTEGMLDVEVNIPFIQFINRKTVPHIDKNALTKKGTILAYAGTKDDYRVKDLVLYNDAYYACFQHCIIDTHITKNGDKYNYICTCSDEFKTYLIGSIDSSSIFVDYKYSDYEEIRSLKFNLNDKLFFNLMLYNINDETGKKEFIINLIPCYNTIDKTYGVFDTVKQEFYAADNQNSMFGGNSLLVYSGGGNS